MPYRIGNRRPSVLLIPDAGVRLEPDGMATVPALTQQIQGLLAIGAVALAPTAPAPAAPSAPANVPVTKKGGRTASAAVKEPTDDAR